MKYIVLVSLFFLFNSFNANAAGDSTIISSDSADSQSSFPAPPGVSDLSKDPSYQNAVVSQAIIDFKKWFNIDVTADTLDSTFTKLNSAYYVNLKNCAPGDYKYPDVNGEGMHTWQKGRLQRRYVLSTTTIKGFQNGKCVVVLDPNTKDEGDCQYTQDQLNQLIALQTQPVSPAGVPVQLLQALDNACQAKYPNSQ